LIPHNDVEEEFWVAEYHFEMSFWSVNNVDLQRDEDEP
jgi:hypothetical protein